MATKICKLESCRQPFTPKRSNQKFCCSQHQAKSKYVPKLRPMRECALKRCGKSFRPHQNNQIFCCTDHQKEFNKLSKMKSQEKFTLKCIYPPCQKEFETWRSDQLYCSRSCQQKNKYHQHKKYKSRLCQICGEPVSPNKYKYCDNCSYEDRGRKERYVHRKTDYNFETPTTCKCPMCEKLHTVNIYWRGRGMPRIYCDQCKYLQTVQQGQMEEYFGCGRP